ncbi:MAG: 50S ribosomal protein L18 [Planctomycetota bacterium]|jgi:large subunit ribosomal protein L18|nr:50S ribosomal protein L18 [Planctomycetota bacterium]GDY05543.1 50S ribosomal protein L18 [Phycisphaerae bacterium]
MDICTQKRTRRSRRRKGLRKTLRGTPMRPRLAVFRSPRHIYVQIIDDLAGRTLAAASSKDKEFAGKVGGNSDAATAVGRAVAERAIKAGVGQVVFDRGGYLYHGRVKALAEAARAAGLKF